MDFVDPLRTDYLLPLARLLYPDWVGKELDSHRAFVVKYSMGDDVELSYHFDNAEVTLNVCLGSEFTDGDLYFGSMRTVRDFLRMSRLSIVEQISMHVENNTHAQSRPPLISSWRKH